MTTSDARLQRAQVALEGLSIGDAFGERFFVHPDVVGSLIMQRALPAPPWAYTDDTDMALSLVAVLRRHGTIDRDALAHSFAERCDPGRGYGAGALRLLRLVKGGQDWHTAAADSFAGQGSYGNGAAFALCDLVLHYVPESEVRSRIERAASLSPGLPAHWAVGMLGNGVNICILSIIAGELGDRLAKVG